MVHDNLPRGLQSHVSHSIRELERHIGPVNDDLETISHLAKPLLIGIEDDLAALARVVQEIKDRWAFYIANGAWATSAEVAAKISPARASATQLKNGKDDDK